MGQHEFWMSSRLRRPGPRRIRAERCSCVGGKHKFAAFMRTRNLLALQKRAAAGAWFHAGVESRTSQEE